MIKRVVRMAFKPECVNDFIKVFNESKGKISQFPGCLALSLYNDVTENHVFYTVSIWDKEESLENYRNSELFQSTWLKTKVLFNDKPMAFSLKLFDKVKTLQENELFFQ